MLKNNLATVVSFLLSFNVTREKAVTMRTKRHVFLCVCQTWWSRWRTTPVTWARPGSPSWITKTTPTGTSSCPPRTAPTTPWSQEKYKSQKPVGPSWLRRLTSSPTCWTVKRFSSTWVWIFSSVYLFTALIEDPVLPETFESPAVRGNDHFLLNFTSVNQIQESSN